MQNSQNTMINTCDYRQISKQEADLLFGVTNKSNFSWVTTANAQTPNSQNYNWDTTEVAVPQNSVQQNTPEPKTDLQQEFSLAYYILIFSIIVLLAALVSEILAKYFLSLKFKIESEENKKVVSEKKVEDDVEELSEVVNNFHIPQDQNVNTIEKTITIENTKIVEKTLSNNFDKKFDWAHEVKIIEDKYTTDTEKALRME